MDLDYFFKRKTIRNYTAKEISDSVINKFIEAAAKAPTTGNMQLYSVIVTRDAEVKAQLAPHHFNQPMVTEAPVLLTFCADFHRFVEWCYCSNATPGYGNMQSFISALLDTTIFAQQFVTIAESQGLGCCYIGTTTYNAPDIARTLKLPALVVPVITITVGEPSQSQSTSATERLPLEAIIHHETYHDYTPARIKELYHEKETLEVNKGYVRENGKETLAQVFTDVRYTKANNEYFSRLFYDFIESQGFRFPT